MDDNKINEFIQAIGLMTELWTMTYLGFKKQGMDDEDAIRHTKALISSMYDSMINSN